MIKILFICHGNICRSPMALYYFRSLLKEGGLSGVIQADSAATSTEEIGNQSCTPRDPRQIKAGRHSLRRAPRKADDKRA